ncbi:protein SPA, chloroplastic isoform X2 [Neltuma alba]|uniref:protein SPA, chloroplastic isoform X2 n=1 Tax=Neltuma alba TaxID=207710 RepID=UPI0010A4DDB1|nr:protein SPA, chloroplastic-like isoform X2 [Prosopis alba]XP_028779310.1 protein SPA, chloroplastic-like isoform X2 [Prosopis alba]
MCFKATLLLRLSLSLRSSQGNLSCFDADQTLFMQAANNNRNTKPNSVICGDCDGNGAVLCSQCKGTGVNSADLFNGKFKAGESCWLCGGKKEMLCGNCNGAGFIGGFLSTYDQ